MASTNRIANPMIRLPLYGYHYSLLHSRVGSKEPLINNSKKCGGGCAEEGKEFGRMDLEFKGTKSAPLPLPAPEDEKINK